MVTVATVATAATTAHPEPAGAPGTWLWVHELLDASALAGAARLSAHLPVRPVPLPALMASRWQLGLQRVRGQGAVTVHLDGPAGRFAAGEDLPPGAGRVAGVIAWAGPVMLAPGLPDGAYKAAEWQALLWAWLQGLPAVVVNRPPVPRVVAPAGPVSPRAEQAWWRLRCARAGLPIWPCGADGDGAPPLETGFMLIAGTVIEAPGGARPRWPHAAHARLAQVARAAGVDWLAVNGAFDTQGCWRVGAISLRPDLRRFAPEAPAALAAGLRQLERRPRHRPDAAADDEREAEADDLADMAVGRAFDAGVETS